MGIAVNVLQPGIPTIRVQHHSHEPGAHDGWDQRDTTPTDNDGEEAGAIRVGHRQENLTSSLADSPKDGTPFPYPCLLDQCDIPAKGRKVCPSLREAREVGRDNVRTRVRGLANAVMALAICAKGAGVPRRDPWYAAVAPKGSDTARQGPIQRAHEGIP